jgi:hypothetical protein
MERLLLTHPEGKTAISMERDKYDELRKSFIHSVKIKPGAPFNDLLKEVECDLSKRKVKIKGSLEWNLFWVTLDLESKKLIKRDKTHSPYTYSL